MDRSRILFSLIVHLTIKPRKDIDASVSLSSIRLDLIYFVRTTSLHFCDGSPLHNQHDRFFFFFSAALYSTLQRLFDSILLFLFTDGLTDRGSLRRYDERHGMAWHGWCSWCSFMACEAGKEGYGCFLASPLFFLIWSELPCAEQTFESFAAFY